MLIIHIRLFLFKELTTTSINDWREKIIMKTDSSYKTRFCCLSIQLICLGACQWHQLCCKVLFSVTEYHNLGFKPNLSCWQTIIEYVYNNRLKLEEATKIQANKTSYSCSRSMCNSYSSSVSNMVFLKSWTWISKERATPYGVFSISSILKINFIT